ncbi:hypothetical protein P3T76_016302 [Phytophthora citrophthora]|uniref:Uncharacterized protein n=1 Tax=Phytophthora citrophthora TaxID=4793 RepID=A0AAD9L9G3_9STRA|nr:hypothetical protein P3T76_016302 [Phytophthora citrophthora]
MDDLPIIELLEHYRVDGESLERALAHVSAQANIIAEPGSASQVASSNASSSNALRLRERKQKHEVYGGPSTLELRVDASIANVLQLLQQGVQDEARSFAEAHLVEQVSLNQLVEQRMYIALQHIEQEVYTRTDHSKSPFIARGDNARPLVQSELNKRREEYQDSVTRSEARVVALVRYFVQHERSTHICHEQESEALIDHVEKRLREVVVIAKTAAET